MFYSSEEEAPKELSNQSDWQQQPKDKKIKVKIKKRSRGNKNKNKMTSSTYRKDKCQFYNKGNCSKGNQCTYSHDFQPDTNRKICKYFLTGACTKDTNCQYSHNTSIYPCKYFHIENECQFANNCRFSHEAIPQDFFQEYMKDNKEHILKVYKENRLQKDLIEFIRGDIPKIQIAPPQIAPLVLPEISPIKKNDISKQINNIKRQVNMMWIDSSKKDPRQKFIRKPISQPNEQTPKPNLLLVNKQNPFVKQQQVIKKEQDINEIFLKQLKKYLNSYY